MPAASTNNSPLHHSPRAIKICVSSLPAFTRRPVKRLLCGEERGAASPKDKHIFQPGYSIAYRRKEKLAKETAKIAGMSPQHIALKKDNQKNLNAQLKPRSVLITGGCGFIGSNFINYIFAKWPEARLINLDKLAFGASPDHIVPEVRNSDRYIFVHGTLMDQNLVEGILREHQIDTIIHFAAITHVDESYSDRVGTIQENVIATTKLLEAINAFGQSKRLVHISTDEVYGDSADEVEAKSEESPLNPTNPYASSKAACEIIVRSYHHSFKLPYVMVRMNNVYGPRQAYSKLIPKFTRLALEGKPYPLMGDGMHTRSWMFVDDCAEAIKRVTENGRIGQIYNIGTEFEKCNLHLTEMLHEKVQKLLARESSKIAFKPIPDRPYHDRRYHIDFKKIRDELGWKCVVPFEEGLYRTLDYYVKEYQKEQRESTAAERPHG